MPTTVKYRLWCHNCNDWQLFLDKIMETPTVYRCQECKCEHTEIDNELIPGDKLKEQRERYKKSQNNSMNYIGARYLLGGFGGGFSMPVGSDVRIIEADAGQKEIDDEIEKINLQKRELENEQNRVFLQQQKKYAHLCRNDICLCGSGKKYKKCCLTKFK